MNLLTPSQIKTALIKLGELAAKDGLKIELVLLGGAVMALQYNARSATKDIDVVIYAPEQRAVVWKLAAQVAAEIGLPEGWLNDAAKGYVSGFAAGETILELDGITVIAPVPVQMLAMKLSAWRDDVDVEDARRLLQELRGDKDEIWNEVQKYLIPGMELKAQYALDDLWELQNGDDGSTG